MATDDWNLTPTEAVARQRELAGTVEVHPLNGRVRRIVGLDCGFEESGRVLRAAAVVMTWPGLDVVEEGIAREPTRFPYVPGLLSFRELPAVLHVIEALRETPDLVLYDGQGIAHPRRIGIAAHFGLVTGLPTIGVGKSRLCGEHEIPGIERGDATPLTHKGERIGTVLRTRRGIRPLFVSPGHRVDHADAVHWVLATLGRYRLPEPIRAADRLASRRGLKERR